MVLTSGTLTNGADFTFKTRLGPAASHQYYFVAEDLSGNQLWRYPNNGDLDGPVVELLSGRNVLGLAADINAYALDANEAFNQKSVYRWIADSGPMGRLSWSIPELLSLLVKVMFLKSLLVERSQIVALMVK